MRRLASPFLLALATLLVACAPRGTAGGGDQGPLPDVTGSYEFSGRIAGLFVEGTIMFPPDGGYVVRDRSRVCNHTYVEEARELVDQLRRGRIRLECDDYRLEINVVDGGLATVGQAHWYDTVTNKRRAGCAVYDENGRCIRYRYVEDSRMIRRRGSIEVGPGG